jgi:hypothetical protein
MSLDAARAVLDDLENAVAQPWNTQVLPSAWLPPHLIGIAKASELIYVRLHTSDSPTYDRALVKSRTSG